MPVVEALKSLPEADRPKKLCEFFAAWERAVSKRITTLREEMGHSYQKAQAGGTKGIAKSFVSQAAAGMLMRIRQRYQALGGRLLSLAPPSIQAAVKATHTRVVHRRPTQTGGGVFKYVGQRLEDECADIPPGGMVFEFPIQSLTLLSDVLPFQPFLCSSGCPFRGVGAFAGKQPNKGP